MRKINPPPAAAAELLRRADLPPEEVEQRLASALERSFWSSLVPFASIEDDAALSAEVPIPEPHLARELRRLVESGYFMFGPVLSTGRIARMRRIIGTLRETGWPAVFAFVFDDFWTVARGEPTRTFLERALGAGYRQNSTVWAHWVA